MTMCLKQGTDKLMKWDGPSPQEAKRPSLETLRKNHMDDKRLFDDDDGRVVADMSGVERQPMLFPDPESIRRVKEKRSDFAEPVEKQFSTGPEYLDKEGRRAMIGGALSAMLLVGGVIFAAFAAVILIIGHLH